jgi:hypothetical protein
MRNDSILSEVRQARPSAAGDVEPPLEVCERILATAPARERSHRPARRRRTWLGWSTRTLALVAGTLTLTGAATAATLIATHAPTPNGKEVAGPTGYVAYWQDGKLTRITDCGKTPDAIECRGDRDQQRATEMRIQGETMRAISSGQDRDAAVLFLKADGGELGCAGARACSYIGGEPNAGKPLPRIGASE